MSSTIATIADVLGYSVTDGEPSPDFVARLAGRALAQRLLRAVANEGVPFKAFATGAEARALAAVEEFAGNVCPEEWASLGPFDRAAVVDEARRHARACAAMWIEEFGLRDLFTA